MVEKRGFSLHLSLGTTDILDQIIPCCRACSVLCCMLNILPGLSPLGATMPPFLAVTIENISRTAELLQICCGANPTSYWTRETVWIFCSGFSTSTTCPFISNYWNLVHLPGYFWSSRWAFHSLPKISAPKLYF